MPTPAKSRRGPQNARPSGQNRRFALRVHRLQGPPIGGFSNSGIEKTHIFRY